MHIQCRQHHIIGNAAHHRSDQGAQQQPQGHFARLDHRLHFISLGPGKLGLKIIQYLVCIIIIIWYFFAHSVLLNIRDTPPRVRSTSLYRITAVKAT